MIIARIIPHAGLGNQMFMYAAGLSAASRLGTELRLGAWNWEHLSTPDRPFHLWEFPQITERNASFLETLKIVPKQAVMNAIYYKPVEKHHVFRRAVRKLCRCIPSRLWQAIERMYAQKSPGYEPEFEHIQDNTFTYGYFESEKYFAGIKDLVRKKFTFPQEYFDPELSHIMRGCNSVALHVRRTDKVREDDSRASNLPYLTRAIDKMKSLTENPVFFVFSDDIGWCRENLPKVSDEDYRFVEGRTPPQDMALMTICRHIITGPSTFSWWGAWLNGNPDKIIITPNVSQRKRDAAGKQDFIPSSWIMLA